MDNTWTSVNDNVSVLVPSLRQVYHTTPGYKDIRNRGHWVWAMCFLHHVHNFSVSEKKFYNKKGLLKKNKL